MSKLKSGEDWKPVSFSRGRVAALAMFMIPFMALGIILFFKLHEWSGLLFVVIPLYIMVLVIWPKTQSQAMKGMLGMGRLLTMPLRGSKATSLAPSPIPGPEGLEWWALARGGANFQSHRLITTPSGTVRVGPSLGMWLFASVFAMPGVVVIVFGVFGEMSGGSVPIWVVKAGITTFGGIFLASGVGMIWFARRTPVFDAQSQYCYGLKPGIRHFGETPEDVSFSRIIGIQLLVYLETGGDSSYACYQLNLVSKDLSRWAVLCHGNLPAIEADAQTLAQLLRVPIWKKV